MKYKWMKRVPVLFLAWILVFDTILSVSAADTAAAEDRTVIENINEDTTDTEQSPAKDGDVEDEVSAIGKDVNTTGVKDYQKKANQNIVKETDAEEAVFLSGSGNEAAVTAAAEPENEDTAVRKKATSVEIAVEQVVTEDIPDGNQVKYTVFVRDEEGNTVSEEGNVKVYYNGNYSAEAKPGNDGEYVYTRTYGASTKTYSVHAEYSGSDNYEPSVSETIEVSFIKPSLSSQELSATPSKEGQGTGTITVDGDYPGVEYRRDGSSEWTKVEGITITGLEPGKYDVRVSAYQNGNKIYVRSSGSFVTISKMDGSKCIVELVLDDLVKWEGQSRYLVVPAGGSKSVYVHAADKDKYYIEKVTAHPAENADITYYDSTGEVYISNISGDITLTATAAEKRIPAELEVSYHFVEDGNHSEYNSAVKVEFEVLVKDQFGEAVPAADVYFKSDETEVSRTHRKTDLNGTASFSVVYVLGEWGRRGDYTAQFALTSDFENIKKEQPIHIVQQRWKETLELYEDQIIGSAPGENNGKIIRIPDNYELFTGEVRQGALVVGSGEVHQGALVVGTGEWIRPVNGEFTGLSAGQHIIRAGEWADYDNDTFYLSSNFVDFTVPRGVWIVKADIENSEHVEFTGETEQAAEPGGTVYIYVKPAEGYKIVTYTIDHPNRLSGEIRYSEENNYIALEGVSGSITLTVKAEEIPESTDTQEPSVSDDKNAPEESGLKKDEEKVLSAISAVADLSVKSGAGTKTGEEINSDIWTAGTENDAPFVELSAVTSSIKNRTDETVVAEKEKNSGIQIPEEEDRVPLAAPTIVNPSAEIEPGKPVVGNQRFFIVWIGLFGLLLTGGFLFLKYRKKEKTETVS